ncbi:MAG: ABC transporter substrate-binding protein [Lautropia sp.]|nr:ABC transporter substrate-binding protein [Lautropia sp.]
MSRRITPVETLPLVPYHQTTDDRTTSRGTGMPSMCLSHVCRQPPCPRPLAARRSRLVPRLAGLLAALMIGLGAPCASAATLRWAAQSDILTLDPHAHNHPQTQAILQQVYEGLTRYSPANEVEPALAAGWTQRNALTWRFFIRQGVNFHDGSPLRAADVVFSMMRLKEAGSPASAMLSGIRTVKRVDDYTVDFLLEKPLPLLPRQLVDARILSERWAKKHKATKAQNLKIHEDTYASRHANGTGPFQLAGWIPSQQLILQRHDRWWDETGFPGNIRTVVYQPITTDQGRISALQRQQVDLVTDLPLQRIPPLQGTTHLKVASSVAQRTLMIGMDQFSARLAHGNAKGANPFKDVRVRQALSLAIDNRRLYRVTETLSRPAGTIVAPGVNGWSPHLDQRPARNLAQARQLLASAGYPNGFEVTLDCPHNRYAFDQEICHALVPMWRQIGVQVKVNTLPFASLVPKLETLDSSFWMIGWGSPNFDALQSLLSLVYTRSGKLDGAYNAGRISNPALDRLIDRARFEANPHARRQLLQDALQIVKEQHYYLPLRHPMHAWVINRRFELLSPPIDRPEMRFVSLREEGARR